MAITTKLEAEIGQNLDGYLKKKKTGEKVQCFYNHFSQL